MLHRRCIALALLLASCHCDAKPTAPNATGEPDAAPAPPADAGPVSVQILEEGAEPRAVLSYAFVPHRKEYRVLQIESLIESKATVDDQIELRFAVSYPAPDTVALRLYFARATAADVHDVASTVGTRAVQKIGKDGTADPPEVVTPPGADGSAAEYVKGAIVQIAATLVPLLPATPIGVGARWRWGADGPVYRLVSRSEGDLVVERTHEVHGKHRLDRGKLYDVDEEQWAHVDATLSGIAQQIESKVVTRKGKGALRTTHMRFSTTSASPSTVPE